MASSVSAAPAAWVCVPASPCKDSVALAVLPSFFFSVEVRLMLGFPGGSAIKNLPSNQETRILSLGWEDPLEKEMATHSSILAWEIRREEPGGLQSMRLQRIRHNSDLLYNSCAQYYMSYRYAI